MQDTPWAVGAGSGAKGRDLDLYVLQGTRFGVKARKKAFQGPWQKVLCFKKGIVKGVVSVLAWHDYLPYDLPKSLAKKPF